MTEPPILTIVIPVLPPSVNKQHRPGLKTRRAGGKTFISPTIFKTDEAKLWVSNAALYMRPFKLLPQRYYVEVKIVSNWYCKDGVTPLVKDCRNHGKLVVDAVFARYGVNDCWVWDDRVVKCHNTDREAVEVSLWRYDDQP